MCSVAPGQLAGELERYGLRFAERPDPSSNEDLCGPRCRTVRCRAGRCHTRSSPAAVERYVSDTRRHIVEFVRNETNSTTSVVPTVHSGAGRHRTHQTPKHPYILVFVYVPTRLEYRPCLDLQSMPLNPYCPRPAAGSAIRSTSWRCATVTARLTVPPALQAEADVPDGRQLPGSGQGLDHLLWERLINTASPH